MVPQLRADVVLNVETLPDQRKQSVETGNIVSMAEEVGGPRGSKFDAVADWGY